MPAFLQWNIEKVLDLFRNDCIIIDTELHVFTAAMRWIQHNRRERLQFFPPLMETVRWMFMTQEEIPQCVDQERQLLQNDKVRPGLIQATWYKTFKNFQFAWKDYPMPPPRTRELRSQNVDDVVEKLKIGLPGRHSSFDRIWAPYQPVTPFIKRPVVKDRAERTFRKEKNSEDDVVNHRPLLIRKSEPLRPVSDKVQSNRRKTRA